MLDFRAVGVSLVSLMRYCDTMILFIALKSKFCNKILIKIYF